MLQSFMNAIFYGDAFVYAYGKEDSVDHIIMSSVFYSTTGTGGLFGDLEVHVVC